MPTNDALDMVAAALRGQVSDLQIKFIALGAGNAPVSPNDTQLADERFRKSFSRQTELGNGATQTLVYIAPHEAVNFPIREIGFFAGDDATEDPNSGTLVGRFLYSRQKTALESLQITRDDLIGRAGP